MAQAQNKTKKNFIPVALLQSFLTLIFSSGLGNVRLHFVCFVLFCTELVSLAHQVLAQVLARLDSSVSGYVVDLIKVSVKVVPCLGPILTYLT